MADFNNSLRNAAAKPSREAPLSAVETRLRRRHRLRQGAVGVCAIALVGTISGGIALSTDDGPSIGTTKTASAGPVSYGDPPLSVELPDGWVESPLGLPYPHEVLAVGTAVQPTGIQHNQCLADPEYQDDVFVMLREYTHVELLRLALDPNPGISGIAAPFPDRPADFANVAHDEGACVDTSTPEPTTRSSILIFKFQDGGRMFYADVSFGASSSAEHQAEAFAVLNSLVVTPLTVDPEPVATSVPTGTAPESADTAAIALAFETWIGSKPPQFDGNDAVVEDWASIEATAKEAAQLVGNPQCYTGRVDAITRIDEDDADVIFTFLCDGQPAIPSNARGRAVKIDGVWMVSHDTVCETYAIGAARCPARS